MELFKQENFQLDTGYFQAYVVRLFLQFGPYQTYRPASAAFRVVYYLE